MQTQIKPGLIQLSYDSIFEDTREIFLNKNQIEINDIISSYAKRLPQLTKQYHYNYPDSLTYIHIYTLILEMERALLNNRIQLDAMKLTKEHPDDHAWEIGIAETKTQDLIKNIEFDRRKKKSKLIDKEDFLAQSLRIFYDESIIESLLGSKYEECLIQERQIAIFSMKTHPIEGIKNKTLFSKEILVLAELKDVPKYTRILQWSKSERKSLQNEILANAIKWFTESKQYSKLFKVNEWETKL